MCGIVGIIGGDAAVEVAVSALCRLEYRGYDSFGVAYFDRLAPISLRKDVGSVSEAHARGFFAGLPSSKLAIAHTRWATHGGVTARNAHPHLSTDGNFAVVHNGVIENHTVLRRRLEGTGYIFRSETDTEVVAHLLEDKYRDTGDVLEALLAVVSELEGEFALVVLTSHEPGKLFCARRNSPLAYLHSSDMAAVASDQRALLPFGNEIRFLEEGDILVLGPSVADTRCFAHDAGTGRWNPVEREAVRFDLSTETTEKGPFEHYMLKEIFEISQAAQHAIGLRSELLADVATNLRARRIVLTGSGSAFYVAQIGQYYFADLANRYTPAHPADELLHLVRFGDNDHLVATSQSGETFDTLETVREALARGATVTAINNVFGSTMQRLATYPIFQGAGAEICVLSTKSIISQCLLLLRLAQLTGQQEGNGSSKMSDLSKALREFPSIVRQVLETKSGEIQTLAQRHAGIDNWFFIGRGLHYPVAMESALKFKEVSYHHAEGMPAGFFKHGTISLISDAFYTIAFLPDPVVEPKLYAMTASNIAEIRARNGKVLAFGHSSRNSVEDLDLLGYIELPRTHRLLGPLLQLVAGQLLAYHCAHALGRNIDKPRALAKSVTVR